MPSWTRKIGESPLQQDAYRIAQALQLIAQSGVPITTSTTTTTTTTV